MKKKCPFVSVVMPCRNEENKIKLAINSLLTNTYGCLNFEIIVVDGMSTDNTLSILYDYQKTAKNFKVLKNIKKIVPVAMNLGIKEARGEIIIRADAHALYHNEYIAESVKALQLSGIWCVGGKITTLPGDDSYMAKVIAVFLSSRFGVGSSHFRIKSEKEYVDTVPFGAFRKDIFQLIGGYKDELVRHQDYELCARIRKCGGKIYLSSKIKSRYYARPKISKLAENAMESGMWDAFCHQRYPYTFTFRHSVIPAGFMLAICFLLIFGAVTSAVWKLTIGPLLLYFVFGAISGYKKLKARGCFLVPLVGLIYHFAFGLGVLKGWFLILTRKLENYGFSN